jgi:SAM-dependent methyltransferase
MLEVARAKISAMPGQARHDIVRFHQADILQPWTFAEGLYDLVTFSLVLEHIADLGPVMREVAHVLKPGGQVYIGELHPFKQYGGTKARFETDGGTQVVPCFDHHISDFIAAAVAAGLHLSDVQEYFDADDRSTPPRVLVVVLSK